jgi:hypothetical protein
LRKRPLLPGVFVFISWVNPMAKLKRPSYDDKFRASAVVMLQANGYPTQRGALEYTAKHLHVPARTLSRWFNGEQNPPPDQEVSKKASDIKSMINSELDAIFAAMATVRPEATYRDLGTVAGILFDKKQLIEGKPTEIVDGTLLTDEARADRIAAVLDGARTRRDRQADSEFVQ